MCYTFFIEAVASIGKQNEEMSLFSGLLQTTGPFCSGDITNNYNETLEVLISKPSVDRNISALAMLGSLQQHASLETRARRRERNKRGILWRQHSLIRVLSTLAVNLLVAWKQLHGDQLQDEKSEKEESISEDIKPNTE